MLTEVWYWPTGQERHEAPETYSPCEHVMLMQSAMESEPWLEVCPLGQLLHEVRSLRS